MQIHTAIMIIAPVVRGSNDLAYSAFSKSIPLHIDTNSTSFLSLNMEGQPLTTGAIICMIAVCSIILLLVAVGTIVELLQPLVAAWKEMKKQENMINGMLNKDFSASDSDTYSSVEIDPLLGDSHRPGFVARGWAPSATRPSQHSHCTRTYLPS